MTSAPESLECRLGEGRNVRTELRGHGILDGHMRKLIVASADAHRPPGRQSAPLGEDRLPTPADFQAWRAAYEAVAPDPAHFEEFAAKTSAMVHEFPGWTDELRSLQAPALLIFGDRDFTPLPDVYDRAPAVSASQR